MRWDADQVFAAFRAELEKIGEINLSGLSPSVVLAQKTPEPFGTEGLKRAQEILDRSLATKTASRLEDRREKQLRDVRRAGSATLAGAGIGRLLSDLSLSTTSGASPRRRTVGTALGASAGLADHLLEKRYQKRKLERKKSEMKKHADTMPAELQQLELDKKIDSLSRNNPGVDANKLRSKVKAMHRGAAIGGALAPVAFGASMLHPAVRKVVKEDWASSPVRTALTYTPSMAAFMGLGGKAGSHIAGKLHDLKHGSPVEKTSGISVPRAQLQKTQSAFRFSTQKTFRPAGAL